MMLTERNLKAVYVTGNLTFSITMFQVNVSSPVYYVKCWMFHLTLNER